ncbi:hypothetical protein FOZ62_032293, partial [Perkinsus olseni]
MMLFNSEHHHRASIAAQSRPPESYGSPRSVEGISTLSNGSSMASPTLSLDVPRPSLRVTLPVPELSPRPVPIASPGSLTLPRPPMNGLVGGAPAPLEVLASAPSPPLMPVEEEKYRCTLCQSIVLASELESHEAFCPPKEEDEDQGYFSDEPSAPSAGPQEPNPTLEVQEEAPSTTVQSKPGKGIWTHARPDFGTSTRDFILRVEANRRRLKAEIDSEELRECTFTPRLSNRKTVVSRSHGFSHRAGRQQRLAIVEEEMHKECSHRPKICARSAELARSRNSERRVVYERLYETDRPLSSRHCGSEPNPELVPHPGGSRRGCRRSTTLYSEAAQRQSRRSKASSDLEAIVAEQASQGTKLSRGSQ